MNCKNVKQHMIFLSEGSLEKELDTAMREHLANCDQCSYAYRQILQTLAVIESEKQIEIDPWFASRVEQQIIQLKAEPKTRTIAGFKAASKHIRAIPVAASLILALWIGITLGSKISINNYGHSVTDDYYTDLIDDFATEDIYQVSLEAFLLTNGNND